MKYIYTILATMLVTYIATTSGLVYYKQVVEDRQTAELIKATEACDTAPTPFACEW